MAPESFLFLDSAPPLDGGLTGAVEWPTFQVGLGVVNPS